MVTAFAILAMFEEETYFGPQSPSLMPAALEGLVWQLPAILIRDSRRWCSPFPPTLLVPWNLYFVQPIKCSRYYTAHISIFGVSWKDEAMQGCIEMWLKLRRPSHSQLSACASAGPCHFHHWRAIVRGGKHNCLRAGQTCSCRSRSVLFVLEKNAASLTTQRHSAAVRGRCSTFSEAWLTLQSCLNAT